MPPEDPIFSFHQRTSCLVLLFLCHVGLTHVPAAVWCVGHCKTVEFTFDMREDTADCIAKEMMDDLSLSEDEAAKIAKKIKEEIGRLVSRVANSPCFNCSWRFVFFTLCCIILGNLATSLLVLFISQCVLSHSCPYILPDSGFL